MIYVLIQIIIAIILIVLMGVLAYGIYNKNAREILLDIMTPTTIKKKTKILDGVYEYNIGKTVKVKIESTNQNSLFGKIENSKDMKAA